MGEQARGHGTAIILQHGRFLPNGLSTQRGVKLGETCIEQNCSAGINERTLDDRNQANKSALIVALSASTEGQGIKRGEKARSGHCSSAQHERERSEEDRKKSAGGTLS